MKKDDTAPYLWSDRKRILGMPISFTQYKLSKDRLFLQRGLFNTAYDETVLYRIRDISVTISLGQRLFGVGTANTRMTAAWMAKPKLGVQTQKRA